MRNDALDIAVELDAKSLAVVADIKRSAGLWSSLVGNKNQTPEDYVAQSEMSPEELEAELAGENIDGPQMTPSKAKGPSEAELYQQHMETMAADMGIDTRGMNIDQITDAVQVAQADPSLVQQDAPRIGENAVGDFFGFDIRVEQGQDMNLAEIQEAGVPTVGTHQPSQEIQRG